MDKIDLSWRITTFEGYNFASREAPSVIDAKSLDGLFESTAGNKPLILIAVSTRPGNTAMGEWPICMGETKKILCYESEAYKKVEAERLDREQREQCKRVAEAKAARRQAAIQAEVRRMQDAYAADRHEHEQKAETYQEQNLADIAETQLIAAGLLEPEGIESENEKVVVHE